MSSPETRTRYVVAFPRIAAVDAWREILAVRERFDPLAQEIPAHVTLVFPFEDTLSDAALEMHLRRALSGCARFAVTFGGITAHENEYLFLNVKRGNDAFIALHDALYTGPLARHLNRQHTYVPHVTVGRLPAHQLAAALAATSTVTCAIDAVIDTLSLRCLTSDGTRASIMELPLPTAA